VEKSTDLPNKVNESGSFQEKEAIPEMTKMTTG
jgi:hypothetical protein